MARPLRILFKDAYYHVINRGQGRRDIFLDEKDYKIFLRVLKEACRTYKVIIVGYCLMSNHYHLLVHTPQGNLPGFMRQINGVYTQIFNKKYKHDGSLFKGRYKAIVVQEGTYLLRLVRYIHNNPTRAKLAKRLCDYRYSSHRLFLEGKESEWLKFKNVLHEQFGRKNLQKEYRNFMGKGDEELYNYLNGKRIKALHSVIFGDKEYADQISKAYLKNKRIYGEIPQGKKIAAERSADRITTHVKKTFKVKKEDIFNSMRGKENIPRLISIGLIRECCGMSHREIGLLFGGISYKSVAKYCERIKARCRGNKQFEKMYEGLRIRCSQVET